MPYTLNDCNLMDDEGIFKDLFEGKEHYTHVPLPQSVYQMLKPKDENGYILHAFIYHERISLGDKWDNDSMVLGYDKCDGRYIARGPGIACSCENPPIHTWDNLAEEIAANYPHLAVKHRKKKNKTKIHNNSRYA